MKKKIIKYFLLFNVVCLALLCLWNQYRLYSYNSYLYPIVGMFSIAGILLMFTGVALMLDKAMLRKVSLYVYIAICSIMLIEGWFEVTLHPWYKTLIVSTWGLSNIIASIWYINKRETIKI